MVDWRLPLIVIENECIFNSPCSRSPVFRAMMLGSMQEAAKSEAHIEDIDERTLENLISFIYTGDFQMTPDTDVQELARAGDKYLLPGLKEVLCQKLQEEVSLKSSTIADMLIAANR